MEWAQRFPAERMPDLTEIGRAVRSPYWQPLCAFIEETWGAAPLIQYSGCSMAAGWNVKYRKGGRAICTLYPGEGAFLCMVALGGKQQMEAELALAGCDPYVLALYRNAKPLNGSRWLSIRITSRRILEDVETLLRVRMKK